MRDGYGSRFQAAAFATALHDALVAQVPGQQAPLDAALSSTLAGIPNWQPTPPTFGLAVRAGQKDGRSFLLASNSQFRPAPPPALDSAKFLNALAEIRAYGQDTSSVRTPAQTDTANFIYQDSYALYGQVLRAVLADTHHSLAWDARAVAAFHVIAVDTQIAIFEAKYTYTFWRPVTAIRTGSVDPDPTWTPLWATPRHPEYPSGHAGYAGAAEGVLTALTGPWGPGADPRHLDDRPRLGPHLHTLVADHPGDDRRPRLGGSPLPLLRRDGGKGRQADRRLGPAAPLQAGSLAACLSRATPSHRKGSPGSTRTSSHRLQQRLGPPRYVEVVNGATNDLICLKCRGRMRTYERNGITIDQCTVCHGIFLDRGELERLIGAESSYLGAHSGEGPQADRDRGFLGDLFD